MRIREITVTPVAFRDPPLLNAAGVHEPWALRSVVEVVTDDGLSGLGESYGDASHLDRLRAAARALTGADPGQGAGSNARLPVGEYGFRSLKLKGGVFPPDQEIEAVRALAAMTHLAAATPNLDHSCDTHTPWQQGPEGRDVIRPGALTFTDGAVPLPPGPGLGVELDRDALAVLHEQYERCGVRRRDDTAYMRRFRPGFAPARARW
ncbi:hypothetical protein O7599_11645 [Streptomyces sp. WMMC500]|uniref:enolase C-terminal domain-like protein n=1 Tax=Streptomyces sp. WMMC500 TaxID=3015154 RepID=UPI00248C8D13|nr:enolase C-terminal domain-like protein [Streptomyces sp. WMMC500]WBB64463.1 hypothetical protein O7599_11645 [Streptomyces sp. WMMC500]